MGRMCAAFFSLQWDLECKHRTLGVITSLHKGGKKDKTQPASYRPIQLLSCLDRCYDRIINTRLSQYLEANNLLHEAQNGFRPKRDCLEHVLTLRTILAHRRELGLDTYVVAIDGEKAYDTAWREGILHKLWGKGVNGRLFRVIKNMMGTTHAKVTNRGAESAPFPVNQGVDQGDTLSPTLYNIFVDGLLEDVWTHCDGIPLGTPSTPAGKVPAFMFADDFIGLAVCEEAAQALVDRVSQYYATWRQKANVDKSAVMVCRGKVPGRGGRQQATAAQPSRIRWGGASGQCIPEVTAIEYMGITVTNTGEWGPHLTAARDKLKGKVNSLGPALKGRGASGEAKRVGMMALARPVFEWGGAVWHPTHSQRAAVDAPQMEMIKSAFHCPPYTCHRALLQELGMRPMSAWFDKRLLEMWHRVQKMADGRLVKQIMNAPALALRRRPGAGGRLMETWQDRVQKVLADWNIDPQTALNMKYESFKKKLERQTFVVQQTLYEKEMASSTVLRTYASYYGSRVQLKKPASYLCGSKCDRGRELVLQLRTQSLPLASLTGKFGRRSRDNAADAVHFRCPVCTSAPESIPHFLLECPSYDALRRELVQQLQARAATSFGAWSAVHDVEKKAFSMLEDTTWGEGSTLVGSVVAPFVYKIWQQRLAALRATADEGTTLRREADGSDAMA